MSRELQVFEAIAARIAPGTSGTRLHGALAGAVCAGPAGPATGLGPLAAVFGIEPGAVALEAMRAAAAQIEARLRDAEIGFQPLLPEDDAPLARRVERLAEWCEAFVDGFSGIRGEGRARLSAEAGELLVDISAIAGELDIESLAHGDEEDERDYAEIVEFLRVAALNLFAEHAPRDGASGPH
jgi:hypothetical protein